MKFIKTKIRFLLALVIFTFMLSPSTESRKMTSPKPGWPVVTRETKPWSRWWWMGSSVTPADLKAAMEAYAGAGLGGLEITPIYGVHGYENRFIQFLSREWVEIFKYTLAEGQRHDLGIDLAMASGWPFGGPWVSPDDACKTMEFRVFSLKEGERLTEKVTKMQEPLLRSISRRNLTFLQLKYPVSANADSLQAWAIEQVRYPHPMLLQVLMAYAETGDIQDLTSKVNKDGTLDWTAPSGNWKIIAVFEGWHGKIVERAGQGGEGDVIDHFSTRAIDNYLNHFSQAFNGHNLNGMRAWFNDSYEVDDARGEANFTPLLFNEFQNRRGYDLRHFLPALMGDDSQENNSRVLSDYRETISDLILENYTVRWQKWAAKGGKIIRNQAHGAPANILDLYGAADIPETEGEDIVKIKTASSVAHVTGKKLASSESATWLKDHFEASLGDVKQAIDRFLLGGINHIFYHGTTFSPQNAPWPGWLFYAAVHFGPTNTFWDDFGTLNTYITRSQSFLQAGKPDNDILLYYPIADEYAVRGRSLLLHFDGSARGSSLHQTALNLYSKGYSFDYISDRQVSRLEGRSGGIITGGNIYQTMLLPPLKLIPAETFEKILSLAKSGATIMMEKIPEDVPGLGHLAERQRIFRTLKDKLHFKPLPEGLQRAKIGKGQILTGNISKMLQFANTNRESMSDNGLQCIRRINGQTSIYFIANRGSETVNGWVPLGKPFASVVLYNPMTGSFGKALTRLSGTSGEVYLQLVPGESCLVQVFPDLVNVPEYPRFQISGEKIPLTTPWKLTFIKGGPLLPEQAEMKEPVLWSGLEGSQYKAFSGTAVYKTSYAKPVMKADFYRLSLGQVFHSARVSLNGEYKGTLISPPFTIDIPVAELKEENLLEISVTNLMGNRIAAMERKVEPYKIFYNVNFPARDAGNRGKDGLFTTSGWPPQESGLAGPVTLQPMTFFSPTFSTGILHQ
jgi:hypothetical protein